MPQAVILRVIDPLHNAAALASRCTGPVAKASMSSLRSPAVRCGENPLRRDKCASTATEMDLPWPSTLWSGPSVDHRDVGIRCCRISPVPAGSFRFAAAPDGNAGPLSTSDHRSQAAQATGNHEGD